MIILTRVNTPTTNVNRLGVKQVIDALNTHTFQIASANTNWQPNTTKEFQAYNVWSVQSAFKADAISTLPIAAIVYSLYTMLSKPFWFCFVTVDVYKRQALYKKTDMEEVRPSSGLNVNNKNNYYYYWRLIRKVAYYICQRRQQPCRGFWYHVSR